MVNFVAQNKTKKQKHNISDIYGDLVYVDDS